MHMSSSWENISSLLDGAFLQDGVWFAPVSDVFIFSFIFGALLVADLWFCSYLFRTIFNLIKALIQRYIYPGRKSSGKEPDKNKNVEV